MKEIRLEHLKGFQIGHSHHREAVTGCTVILFQAGVSAGVEVRGGARKHNDRGCHDQCGSE